MIQKCVVCNEDFEAKRSTAKYCSNRCKMEFRNKKDDDPIDKIARDGYTAIKSLIWLEHVTESDHERAEARRHLNAMFESLQKLKAEIPVWECKGCGQRIFIEPSKKQPCAFCNKHHGWIQK